MRIETTDPISGNTIHNLDGKPFVIEGRGEGALKIYFETEHPGKDFTTNLDNPSKMGDEK